MILITGLTGPLAANSVHKERRFYHDGQSRLYYMHVPERLPDNAPLVVALHGMGGHAHKMRYGLGLHELANEMGFATVFPQGSMFGNNTSYWNVGDVLGAHDDLGYLSQLISYVTRLHGLDSSRIYVLGISNGGQMAYHLGCHRSEQIAGIAVVIGTMISRDWKNCPQKNPVSLLHIHGLDDPVFRFSGGKSWYEKGSYPAIPNLVARWADQASALQVPAPKPPVSHSWVTRYETANGLPIELVAITGFGHDWPHKKNAGFSAARFIMDFFMTQAAH